MPHWLLDWAPVLAELLVAYVIYLELKANRFRAFEEKALDPATRTERGFIYREFFANPGAAESLQDRRAGFAERIWKDEQLRAKCENEVVVFDHLWFLLRGSPMRRRQVATWFPHVIVPFWAMVGPYVLQKQQARGWWVERELMDFTLSCIGFVERQRCTGRWSWLRYVPFLRESPPLKLWWIESGGARKEIVISDEFLRQMRSEIKKRSLKRWSVKSGAPD